MMVGGDMGSYALMQGVAIDLCSDEWFGFAPDQFVPFLGLMHASWCVLALDLCCAGLCCLPFHSFELARLRAAASLAARRYCRQSGVANKQEKQKIGFFELLKIGGIAQYPGDKFNNASRRVDRINYECACARWSCFCIVLITLTPFRDCLSSLAQP